MSTCKICGSPDLRLIYQGEIRTGRFAETSASEHQILRCSRCQVAALDISTLNYQLTDYRLTVDADDSAASYYRIHDGEQADRLKILGTGDLRGKVVADIGCGAGSFLDLLNGLCSQTIAVEPQENYRTELERKAHHAYPFASDAHHQWAEKVDFAVSFAVIEHVEDPVDFLKDLRRLLKPGGKALISTPNADDWLLETLPETYGSFFYRQAHRWYFNGASMKYLAERAGFSQSRLVYKNNYDFSNAILWLRDREPSGLGKMAGWEKFDPIWNGYLELTGKSNYLYAWLEN